MRLRLLCRVCILALGVSCAAPVSSQEDSLEKLIARGRDFQNQGQFVQAETVFRDALRQAEQRRAEPLLGAAVLDILASDMADEGRYVEAERLFLQDLSVVEHVAGPNSKAVAPILWHFAGMYLVTGQSAAAEALIQKYQNIVLRYPDKDPSLAAAELSNIGRLYAYKHSMKKALMLFEQALVNLNKEAIPDASEMVRGLLDRAAALASVHEIDRAVDDVERAERYYAQLETPALSLAITLRLTAGFVYARADRKPDSEGAFQQAIGLAEPAYGPANLVLAAILRDYADALRFLGDKKQASAVLTRVKRIEAANGQRKLLGSSIDILTLRP